MLSHLVELYYIVDTYCKWFEKEYGKSLLEGKGSKKPRKRKTILTLSEMLTILIVYQSSGFKNFKRFYIFLQAELKGAFTKICSYNRFIELTPRCLIPLMYLMKLVFVSCNGASIVDSTPIKVCNIKREKRHKTFKDLAKKSKSTMGWFFGFKLHILMTTKGELMDAKLEFADVDDREGLRKMCKILFGDVIGDRGYIGKDFKQELSKKGINLITRGRKNMKNHTLTAKEEKLLKKRNMVETGIGKLKIKYNVEHTRHRSVHGLFITFASSVIAYCFCEHKTKNPINLLLENLNPLPNMA